MVKAELLERGMATLGNQLWRLNNLYYITGKSGVKTRFVMNWAQQKFYHEMSWLNLILKARQLGFTTFAQIFMLDAALFNSNTKCGTIAHHRDVAKSIMRDKVRFAYDNLPEQLKAARTLVVDSAYELEFNNGSSIYVRTNFRGGTLQYLHISELGKIAAKYPEKAREIRTGALNTVAAGQFITIESTAEGAEGDFYDLCQQAQTLQRTGSKITPLDFKMHFYPWHQEPGYSIPTEGVLVTAEEQKYFSDLELKHGVQLTPEQRAWWVKKRQTQLEDMKREYPATIEEAFNASVEGAYYGDLIAKAESEGRVGVFKAEPGFPVHTAWDIGRRDANPIWFFQFLPREIRHVGYYENSGEAMPFYAKVVHEMYEKNGWQREGATDFVPHDARVKEWGSSLTRIEQMIAAKLNPHVSKELSLHDGINAVRSTLPFSTFDAENCAEGLKCLKNYRKTWNDDRGVWSDSPWHNWASHGSDARRILSCAYKEYIGDEIEDKSRDDELKDSLSAAAFRDELIRNHEEMRR